MRFGIFIYDGVEPIDLATFGVLSMARRIAPQIEIVTISPKAGLVRLSNDLKVVSDFGFDDKPSCDWLIVTGGPGWTTQAQTPETLAFLKNAAARGNVASVCTGAMILAAAGVLHKQTATTKVEVVPPEVSPLAVMRDTYPTIDARAALLVDNDRIVTGGGVSLCIDATLHLVERVLGCSIADETARILEYRRARDANRAGLAMVIADRAVEGA